MLQQELHEINLEIVDLEAECTSEKIQSLNEEIKAKEAEIEAHEFVKPLAVEQPPEENEDINNNIIELRDEEGGLSSQEKKQTQLFVVSRNNVSCLAKHLLQFKTNCTNLIASLSNVNKF